MKKSKLLILIVIESLLSIAFLINIKSIESYVLTIIFLLQLSIFIVIFTILLLKLEIGNKRYFGLKQIVTSIVISIVTLFVFIDDAGLLYESMKDDFSHDGIKYEWDYYNLFDTGNNIKILDNEKYDLDNDKFYFKGEEFVAYEILKANNTMNVFTNSKVFTNSMQITYDNDYKIIGYTVADKIEYKKLNKDQTLSSYNDGVYLYSIDKENGLRTSKYEQDGTVVSSANLESSCGFENDDYLNIMYVDEYNNMFVKHSMISSKGINITKVSSDGKCNDFGNFSSFKFYPIYTKFYHNDNTFKLVIGDYSNQLYIVDINEKGEIIEEYFYTIDTSIYYNQFLNSYYDGDKLYLISHVRTTENTDVDYLAGNDKIIRIDELDNNYNLINSSYLKSDELGDYSKYFRLDKQEDKYVLYSNSNRIEYNLIPKNKLLIVDKIIIFYALFYVSIALFLMYVNKLTSEHKNSK